MSLRLLLDENIEHEVYHRLRDSGDAVEHVDYHEKLEKGAEDSVLTRYSLDNEALIVTYDDDFEDHHEESDYWGVLFLTDGSWSATEVATPVDRVVELYPSAQLRGMNVVGRQWL